MCKQKAYTGYHESYYIKVLKNNLFKNRGLQNLLFLFKPPVFGKPKTLICCLRRDYKLHLPLVYFRRCSAFSTTSEAPKETSYTFM